MRELEIINKMSEDLNVMLSSDKFKDTYIISKICDAKNAIYKVKEFIEKSITSEDLLSFFGSNAKSIVLHSSSIACWNVFTKDEDGNIVVSHRSNYQISGIAMEDNHRRKKAREYADMICESFNSKKETV